MGAEALVTVPDFPRDGSVKTLAIEGIPWIHEMLVQPDGDNVGGPFRLTREQRNFVCWFYAIDESGKFRYRRAVLRRSKGWGKSPFMGALCLLELCGPTRFDGWNAYGEPVAVPHPMPWVVLAGISEQQAQNTMTVILSMLENARATDEYNLDVGLTRIYAPGGGRLVPITAGARTQEGARPTFACLDETHHWLHTNGGWDLARVIRRNLAKSRDGSARSIETTNAHEPGEESVAEASYQDFLAIQEGRAKASGLLYDSREATGDVDLADEEALTEALKVAYGDASWVDLDRIKGEIYDPSTPPEESRRFYLNQIVAAADSWIAPFEWDGNYDPDLRPLKFAEPGKWREGDTVTLGFDGALRDDSTALVAMRVEDGAPFLLGLWEKPVGPQGMGWEVNKEDVRGVVDHAFAALDVVAFFSDVAYWETDVDAWRDKYQERLLIKATTKHAIAWDMRTKLSDTTRATEALNRAIVEGEVPHNGDQRLRRHVLNARRRPNQWGVSFGKETRESPKKVDALSAMLLARMARTALLATDALSKRRGRVGRLIGFA